MKRISQIDRLKSNQGADIEVENKLEYTIQRDISDFSGNEIPPLNVVLQAINESIPPTSAPLISPWIIDEIVEKDFYRSHVISGTTEYLFRSNVDGNTSEPSLDGASGGPAWHYLLYSGFPPFFDPSISYGINDYVRFNFDSGYNTYISKELGNEGNIPVEGTSNAYWEFIGITRGFFPDDAPYGLNDIVLDPTSNTLFQSDTDNNNYPLDGEIPSPWQLIGTVGYTPDAPLVFVNPIMSGSEGNYGISFNLPSGKSIISIERLQDGIISRQVPVSNAFTIPAANNPNTTIDGFDNNDPQTITIKIN